MKGEASVSWRIQGLQPPLVGLTSVCGYRWRRNLSVNAISEITTAIWDGRGQVLTELWSVKSKKIHERGGIRFMTNSWFAPPIGWTYISVRLPLTAQSFRKCYFWYHHCNLGWQGPSIDGVMVSRKYENSWKGRHLFHDEFMVCTPHRLDLHRSVVTAQSFCKCYFWYHHCNLGRRGRVLTELWSVEIWKFMKGEASVSWRIHGLHPP